MVLFNEKQSDDQTIRPGMENFSEIKRSRRPIFSTASRQYNPPMAT